MCKPGSLGFGPLVSELGGFGVQGSELGGSGLRALGFGFGVGLWSGFGA